MDEPRVVAALPRLIKSSDAVISQAPLGSASRPLAHRTRATSTRAIAPRNSEPHRWRLEQQPQLSGQHEMDRHDDQRRDQHHPSRPPGPPVLEPGAQARPAAECRRARACTCPPATRAGRPAARWAPTVELTTIKSTASERISFCQCSLTNSDVKPDQDRSAGTKTAAAGDVLSIDVLSACTLSARYREISSPPTSRDAALFAALAPIAARPGSRAPGA